MDDINRSQSSWHIVFEFGVFSYPPKTNMTMEPQTFEDVFPVKNSDFPLSCYFLGGVSI